MGAGLFRFDERRGARDAETGRCELGWGLDMRIRTRVGIRLYWSRSVYIIFGKSICRVLIHVGGMDIHSCVAALLKRSALRLNHSWELRSPLMDGRRRRRSGDGMLARSLALVVHGVKTAMH